MLLVVTEIALSRSCSSESSKQVINHCSCSRASDQVLLISVEGVKIEDKVENVVLYALISILLLNSILHLTHEFGVGQSLVP